MFGRVLRAPLVGDRARHENVASNGLLNNLVAYWALNEAGGANNALDLHSNGLTLTQVSSPGADTGKVYSTARTFDGSADYFSRASSALLQLGNTDWTIAIWVYFSDKSDQKAIIGQYSTVDNQRAWSLNYYAIGDQIRLFCSSTGSSPTTLLSSAGVIALSTWHLITFWYSAANDLLYLSIDSATAASTAHVNGVYASSAPFEVGRTYLGLPYFFNGRIGPVAMWKSAPGAGGVLDATKRTALYNSGNGLTYASFTA